MRGVSQDSSAGEAYRLSAGLRARTKVPRQQPRQSLSHAKSTCNQRIDRQRGASRTNCSSAGIANYRPAAVYFRILGHTSDYHPLCHGNEGDVSAKVERQEDGRKDSSRVDFSKALRILCAGKRFFNISRWIFILMICDDF